MNEQEQQTLNKYQETFKKLSEKTDQLSKSIDKIKLDSKSFTGIEESMNTLKKKL